MRASNVSISGLTLDGDNPTLTSGTVRGGADIDARNGIVVDFDFAPCVFNNLVVQNTVVKNIYFRGIYASSGGSFNFNHNTVMNVQGEAGSVAMFNFGGAGVFDSNMVSAANDGIASNHSGGTQFTNNMVTASNSGIHTDNPGDGFPNGTDVISGNTVTNSQPGGLGIYVFIPYKTVSVQNNTVTNVDIGMAMFGSRFHDRESSGAHRRGHDPGPRAPALGQPRRADFGRGADTVSSLPRWWRSRMARNSPAT